MLQVRLKSKTRKIEVRFDCIEIMAKHRCLILEEQKRETIATGDRMGRTHHGHTFK